MELESKRLFRWYFWNLLMRRSLSPAEFARLVGASPTYPASVCNGHAKSPAKRAVLEKWVEALKLNDEERWRFIGLAGLDHAPEWFVEWYWSSGRRHL